VTTRPFVPPPRVPPPEAGGGKIAVEPPIAAPVPPPRSIWGIVAFVQKIPDLKPDQYQALVKPGDKSDHHDHQHSHEHGGKHHE